MPIYKGPAHHRSMNIPHAEISAVDNATATAIAVGGTAVQFTEFDTNGASYDAVPDQGEDHILISTTGTYDVQVTAAVDSVGAGAIIGQFQVQKNNGASEVVPHVNVDLAGSGGEMQSISVGGLAALEAGDTVEFWVENETSTTNLLVESISLSVKQIG